MEKRQDPMIRQRVSRWAVFGVSLETGIADCHHVQGATRHKAGRQEDLSGPPDADGQIDVGTTGPPANVEKDWQSGDRLARRLYRVVDSAASDARTKAMSAMERLLSVTDLDETESKRAPGRLAAGGDGEARSK
jgi:hypothetical protein